MHTQRVEVSTTSYVFAHGKEPRGQGGWAFFGVRNGQRVEEPVFFDGTFTEARKQAIEWARANDYTRIAVGS